MRDEICIVISPPAFSKADVQQFFERCERVKARYLRRYPTSKRYVDAPELIRGELGTFQGFRFIDG